MDYSRAQKGYEAFTGYKPKYVDRKELDSKSVAGYKMGPIVGIAYEADRDGEKSQYFHKFKKSARPDLVARDDGKQLYVTGGNYKITDRGIEDKMPGLFVINPSPRRKSQKKAKSTMAVRRRRKRARTTSFRVNPVRRRRARSRRRSVALAPMRRNPIRRRRRRSVAVAGRRYRRNPMRSLGGVMNFGSLLMPGLMVGGGAVGSEIITAYLPIPAAWKTGYIRHVVKGGVGVAAGIALAKFGKQRKLGEFLALGAIAIAAHDLIKDVISTTAPNIKMGEYLNGNLGYSNPGLIANSGFAGAMNGMGEYVGIPEAQF